MSKNFENERTKKAQNLVLRAIFLGNEGIFLPIFIEKPSINSSKTHPKNIS